MDMTSPTILSLYTKVLHSKETTKGPAVSHSTSKASWTESSFPKIPVDIQRDEEGPQTEASDGDDLGMKGKLLLSFETHTRKSDLNPQTWSTESIPPIAYTETYTSQIPTEQGMSETYQTPWKSSGPAQTPYARGTLDATNLPKELIDYLWPSEKTKDLTDAPTGNQINNLLAPTLYFTTEPDIL